MVEFVIIAINILIASTIIIYATWLLMKRLLEGNRIYYSIKEWFKHILEALEGIW
jgi:hypothetical protein